MSSRQPRVFVSHTVRDERDRALAHGIADALQARGSKVWIAPESIPAGDDWEEAIVAGVLDECTHFLVILSAASVRSKWVQAEIELARRRAKKSARFRVLPLRVGDLKRFPNEKYLGTLQAVRYEAILDQQVQAIADAIGLVPALPASHLDLEDDHGGGFVGRDHAFAAIDQFTTSRAKGYFTIVGDPGAGKSSILGELVRRTGCVAHFNSHASAITTTRQFEESICRRLEVRFDIHPLVASTAHHDGERLRVFLKGAAEKVARRGERPLVIAVDALDEVSDVVPNGPNTLLLPQVMPDGVYFIMTRRRLTLPLVSISPQTVWDLSDFPQENRRDIEVYFRAAAKRPKVRKWIESSRGQLGDFLDTLVAKSELNFMYAHYVVQAIESEAYEDARLDALPTGLRGYYEAHWARMGMLASPLPREKIRIIYALSEIARPASVVEISRFASDDTITIDPLRVSELLREWRPFLHQEGTGIAGRFGIYHESFRDFLRQQEVVQAAGIWLDDVRDRIVGSLWEEVAGHKAPS